MLSSLGKWCSGLEQRIVNKLVEFGLLPLLLSFVVQIFELPLPDNQSFLYPAAVQEDQYLLPMLAEPSLPDL